MEHEEIATCPLDCSLIAISPFGRMFLGFTMEEDAPAWFLNAQARFRRCNTSITITISAMEMTHEMIAGTEELVPAVCSEARVRLA